MPNCDEVINCHQIEKVSLRVAVLRSEKAARTASEICSRNLGSFIHSFVLYSSWTRVLLQATVSMPLCKICCHVGYPDPASDSAAGPSADAWRVCVGLVDDWCSPSAAMEAAVSVVQL